MPVPKNIYTVGLRNVGSYQVSGVPYVTGSNGDMAALEEIKVQFPSVTKSITVIHSSSATTPGQILVHFNTAVDGADGAIATAAVTGSAHHYITLASDGDAMTFNTKCKEIYVTCRHAAAGFELYAELTNIPTGSMFRLTGSGLTA
jgi:hypothetical protein